jgi:hypothetical protein
MLRRQHPGVAMADQRKAAMTKAGLGAAVVIAFVSIIFVGRAIEDVAESAAQCMEEAHSLQDCDHPEPAIFWEPVVVLAGVGFLVGVMCFLYGQQRRAGM